MSCGEEAVDTGVVALKESAETVVVVRSATREDNPILPTAVIDVAKPVLVFTE